MDELDRHLERQMRAQERQLVAVRFALVVFAAAVLLALRPSNGLPLLYIVLGAAAIYDLALLALIGRFPAREVGIVATALDMVAVTVAIYAVPGATDTYLFYGIVVLSSAFRFGLGASVWSALVCSALYSSVILFVIHATPLDVQHVQDVQRQLPVRVAYLLGIGLAAGLFSRFIIGRTTEVARLAAQLGVEDRERARAREEALLSQLARDFGSTLDRPATVSAVVQATGDLIGDLAAVWLVDESGERLELAEVTSRQASLAERYREAVGARHRRLGEGVAGRAAATATTVLIGPTPMPVPDAGDPDGIAALGLRSMLAVPILGRGRVRGVLVCASAGAAPVGEAERRLAEAIAERAGPALENAALWSDLQQQVERERAAQRVKDDFLSIVSHELRTPLTSISGYAQLLERRVRDRGDAAKELEQLRVIRTQSGRMRRLVEDLLDVSRIDRRGGVGVEPEPMDLAEELRGLVARTGRQHADREIVLEVPDALGIEADRDRIGQVLTNLVDNAVKYSPEGGPIRVVARRDADGALVEIWDEGVGIADDLRDRVFDLFFQADGEAQRRFGGLGLGLYISRAIVEAHGGKIWATPNVAAGHGTVMHVRLPLRAAPRPLAPDVAAGGEPPPFVTRRPSSGA